MKDHNTANLALQKRIGELNAVIIQRDDQMRELQHQLAMAREQIKLQHQLAAARAQTNYMKRRARKEQSK